MSYLGCAVTIAGIALDPFTQQMLSYQQVSVKVDGLSSTGHASLAYDNQEKGQTYDIDMEMTTVFAPVLSDPFAWVRWTNRHMQ